MIDLKLFERDFANVAEKLKSRGVQEDLLKELKELFEEYRAQKSGLQELQTVQNRLSKLFGEYKRKGEDIAELKTRLEENKKNMAAANERLKEIEAKLESLALNIPNIPDEDVPEGVDENDNVEIKRVLEPTKFDFEPKEHYELGEKLGWIDFKRGVKLAKSRFSVLKNEAAALERALINYMLKFNKNRGFEEIWVPAMVNSTALIGTGQLPKFAEDLFKIEKEDLYMIPTAEVPLTNLYQDEIIPDLSEPIKMTAYTPCFRKEAGSGGKDVRGMIRQHQFDKVELVAITRPQDSDKVFQEMIACASDLLSSLGLPHRLVALCRGDLGFSAAKTVDLEVWLPGQNRYREISSVSNTRDFQARRAKIRYKENGKNRLVHTLNGSSLAVGRTLIAIMENYQKKDGSIEIPKVLEPYM